MNIVDMMRTENDWMKKVMGRGNAFYDFLLANGKSYEIAPKKPKLRTIKQCFKNSLHLSWETKMDYVEGYIMMEDLPILIHHAWCIDSDGKVHDPTLRTKNRPVPQYFGIAIPVDVATKEVVKNGVYGVFYPNHMFNENFAGIL